MSVIKPSNCKNVCKLVVLAIASGSITPKIAIIQNEPTTEPMSSMIIAVITNGLLRLKTWSEVKYTRTKLTDFSKNYIL